jgi:hypothetical protein
MGKFEGGEERLRKRFLPPPFLSLKQRDGI